MATLPLELVRKIIFMQRPKYLYMLELKMEIREWYFHSLPYSTFAEMDWPWEHEELAKEYDSDATFVQWLWRAADNFSCGACYGGGGTDHDGCICDPRVGIYSKYFNDLCN